MNPNEGHLEKPDGETLIYSYRGQGRSYEINGV